MAEHEFERFLVMLSKLLKLSSKEAAAVADEICDHLEERYSELVALGVPRDEAVKQALDEFDDAGEFAAKLNQLVRQRTRRRMMTGALTTAAASALTILVTTAFWPDQPQPAGVIAQSSARDLNDPAARSPEVVYVDEGRFLPEWMRKEVAEDLKPQTLSELKRFLEQFTGRIVGLDHTELTNSGIGPDTSIRPTPAGAPLYLVLDRALAEIDGTELAWIVDPRDGVLKISTREKIDTIKAPFTVDVSPVLAQGLEMSDLIKLIQSQTTGPWHAIDGEGGTIIPLGLRLTITSNQRNRIESQSLLAALATKAPIISLSEPYSTKAINEALGMKVTCGYQEISLSQAIADLSRQTGLRFDFDLTELTNSGVGTDTSVTLSARDVTLQAALDLLLEDVGGVELAAVTRNGLLTITSRERADTLQAVQLLDVSDLVAEEDVSQLVSLILQATEGPWQEIDGEGGAISELPGPRIIVRQTKRGLASLNRLLDDHRAAAKTAIHVPTADPKTIEVRYYRMTETQAAELAMIIPRYVAVGSWDRLADGSVPAIEKVTMIGLPNTGGMGGGGGGFFQIGGAPAEEKPAAGENELLKEILEELRRDRRTVLDASPAMLVIRQTRKIHLEIEKFLKELSRKSGAKFFDPANGPNAGPGGPLGGGGFF